MYTVHTICLWMEGAFSFTLLVAALAVGYFLSSEEAETTTTMASKIQKSYSTQDPVLVGTRYNELTLKNPIIKIDADAI